MSAGKDRLDIGRSASDRMDYRSRRDRVDRTKNSSYTENILNAGSITGVRPAMKVVVRSEWIVCNVFLRGQKRFAFEKWTRAERKSV